MPKHVRQGDRLLDANGPQPAGGTRCNGSAKAESSKYTSPVPVPVTPARRDEYRECPVCNTDNLCITHKPHRDSGIWQNFYHCWGCSGGLNEVSEASGIPRSRLIGEWPLPPELGPAVRCGRSNGRRGTAAPPSQAQVDGFHAALLSSPKALSYLNEKRGLTVETIRRFQLGYGIDKDAVGWPVWDENGELDSYRWRFLNKDAEPKIMGMAGRPAQLYPDVPATGGLLLVAGEFDALVGRQMGLPTVTTTCGTTLPAHLAPRLAGRIVFTMYDVGESRAAKRTTARLRDLGSQAAVVHLALLGLPNKGDLNDFFLQGGTAEEIKALCRRVERGNA
jgi:hypothetical protein